MQHLFVESQLGLLQVALALRQYELENGNFPAAIEQLVPGYLKEVPTDPFAPGSKLRYRPVASEYLIWSVGPDGKDDGGLLPESGRYQLIGKYRGDVGLQELSN